MFGKNRQKPVSAGTV